MYSGIEINSACGMSAGKACRPLGKKEPKNSYNAAAIPVEAVFGSWVVKQDLGKDKHGNRSYGCVCRGCEFKKTYAGTLLRNGKYGRCPYCTSAARQAIINANESGVVTPASKFKSDPAMLRVRDEVYEELDGSWDIDGLEAEITSDILQYLVTNSISDEATRPSLANWLYHSCRWMHWMKSPKQHAVEGQLQ